MIFKKLFRPKHQNPDPKIRLAAVSELSPGNPEQKSLLHELAFNDEDASVILAALKRLNSFPLWLKTAETSNVERVQKKARQVVESALMGEGELAISEQERKTFVLECKNISLLEKLLRQSWLRDGELTLVKHVLSVINKPHLTLQVLFNSQEQGLQSELAKQFEDEQTLQKIVKKTQFDAVRSETEHRLAELIRLKQKPAALEKQVKLVLSQLLALKEKDNYQLIVERRGVLEQEYQSLQGEFDLLTKEQVEATTEKYQDIIAKLDKWLTELKPRWEQIHLTETNAKELTQLSQNLEKVISKVAETLERGVQDITLGQVEEFENALQEINTSAQALSLSIPADEHQQHRSLENMFNRLNSCKTTLESLPEFQLAIENIQAFLAEFNKLTMPDDVSQLEASLGYLKEQKVRWKELTGSYKDSIPEDIVVQWQTVKKSWSKAIDGLEAQIREDVNRCKNKLRVIENMIAQGRFKPAMSLFRKVAVWYEELPEPQRVKLSRQFDKAREQVENLLDWQEYIAQPRKPALLNEAEALVTNPLDIEAQARQVKKLRQQWNSLGKVDSEADQALNEAFEQTLEKAFEPCRAFYAQRQEKREANLQARQQIIELITQLAAEQLSDGDLVQRFRELQKKWQGAGEVDYKAMEEIHNAYRKACAPIQKRLDAYYLNNTELKATLIEQTAKLLDAEDVFAAVDQAKQLQEKWKQAGPSSKKQDAKQWKVFRQLNDQIFARRKELQQEHKQEADQKTSQISSVLKSMESLLADAGDIQAVHHALDEQVSLNDLLSDIPFKLKSKFEKQLSNLKAAQKEKLKQLDVEKKTDQYRVLFEELNAWTSNQPPANLDKVANQWRGCFERIDGLSDHSRQELTIKIEILANKPSPSDESELRQEIQLKMMAEKLQQGHQEDQQTLLKQWIGLGPLSESDQLLLNRIQGVFVSAPN